MNIVTNEKLIRRNTTIAKYVGLGGMVVIVASMALLFLRPNEIGLIWGTLLVGFLLSQVGIYFTNRWGRRPRPDEHLTNALKGLGKDYTLYHYTTPATHLLVGPAGVWVLLPYYQRGEITFGKGRWRQRGGGFLLNYMKIFGQEGLGRPDIEVENEKEAIGRFLTKVAPTTILPPVEAALVFTNEQAVLGDMSEASAPTLNAKKLKEFIRKTAKNKPISTVAAKEIQDAINGTATGAEVEVSEEDEDKTGGEEGKPRGKQPRRPKKPITRQRSK